jgi:hypothetical protein
MSIGKRRSRDSSGDETKDVKHQRLKPVTDDKDIDGAAAQRPPGVILEACHADHCPS